MTRILGRTLPIPGWTNGLVEDAEPGTVPLGTIAGGANFVPAPKPSAQQRTRGGSRIMLTLHDDAGSPAELSHVGLLAPYSAVGAIAVGWSDGQNKHYAYRLTSDMVMATGTEATSRHDLTAAPSASWNNASTPARPVGVELFEKFFLADATTTYASRNELLSIDSSGTILNRTFSFDGGAAESLRPYCLEEYNGVLFLAGYGDGSDSDRPEMLRHSLLGTSPDAAGGFDQDAYLLLGAKGQRVTALRKGRGLLLAAKANEIYRVSGFGRAYPGWQYAVESVQNTTGLGIANPHGLTFAEGFWYGVGDQGPLRTDGFNVESLAGPRQRGWRAMRYPEYAAVSYHPDRKVVLFAVRPTETESGHATTYPWVFWVWDIEREVWATDWKFSTLNVSTFAPIPLPIGVTAGSVSVPGPTAPPTSPASSLVAASGWTASWTNGDATAETEYWEKEGSGGTWTLKTTIAAGVATYAASSGHTDHTDYYWRVRHRKSGITTAYATDVHVQTLLQPPFILFTNPVPGTTSVDVHNNSHGAAVTVTLQSSATGAGVWTTQATFTGVTFGVVSSLAKASSDPARDWRAKVTDAAWSPTDSTYSPTVNG